MNKSFRSIWNEALGSWVAVSESTMARGKRSGATVVESGDDALPAARCPHRIIAALGFSVAVVSTMGTAYASTCGDGSAVSTGGTCVPGTFNPADNDDLAGAVAVSGADVVHLSGGWTGGWSDAGYTIMPLGSTTIVSGTANQPRLTLGAEVQSVSTPASITGGNIIVATYNSGNFVASNWDTANVPVFHNVDGSQYVDARIGTVSSTGGTLDVAIGNPASVPASAGNSIAMAAKETDLIYADGTGAAPSVVTWDSRNQVDFVSLAPGGGASTYTMRVPSYAGTFQAFNGSRWSVTDTTSLAAYNDFLVRSLQSGALNSQSAYDTAFNQAVSFTQQTVQYTNNVSASDEVSLPTGNLSVIHGTGANAMLHVGAGGQIDVRSDSGQSFAVLAENGAHFVNDGQISGGFTLVGLQSGAQGVNNGVISSGYASGNNFNTGTAAQPDNFGYNAYTEGFGVSANGAGTRFINNGIMNVAAWNYTGSNNLALQNYAVAVSGTAAASNAGVINVGVNATNLNSQAIGGLVSDGSFTNLAGGTIYVGRAAQYDAASPEAAADVALSTQSYGVLLGSSGTANNLGDIVVGGQAQNATAMASIHSTSGILNNGGNIIVNGAASGLPLANVGMLADNTAATVSNTGTIELSGVNGIGIEVIGTGSTPTAATSTGTITVAGGADPASGTRNYGVWAQGANATATVDGAVNLTGTGAIGVHARSGATIDVGANAVPDFISGAGQIGFFAYGADSRINVAAQRLAVGTTDSTLFRVAGGAAFTGSSTAGPLTMNINGQNARGVVATDSGSRLSTGNSIYNVNGPNGIAITARGGAAGSIDSASVVNLNAAGAIAGLVDGQPYDLTNAPSGAPVATVLTNNAAVRSGTAGVTGFVAQNLGVLANNSTVTLTGAGSTGVVVGSQGTVSNASTICVSNGTGALVQGATASLINNGTTEADDGIAAIRLTGAGASVGLPGSATVIAGGTADGIQIDASDSAGSATAGPASITVSGSGKGIDNLGENSTIALSGTRIGTTGAASDGVSSTGARATISADAATIIKTAGDHAVGLFVSGAGSTVTNSGAAVTTTGQNAIGIEMINGASATLTAGSVSTAGQAAPGVQASGAGSSILSNNGTIIRTAGAASIGADANAGGSLALRGAQIATTGISAHGVVAASGGTATLATTAIKTTGTLADGVVAQNGGTVADTGSTISSAAANGATADSGGVLTLSATTLNGATSGVVTSDTLANGATSVVTVNGGNVTSATGPAFLANGGTADLIVQNGTVATAGNGTLLNLTNGSNVTFTASNENLTGNIFADVASTGNVFLTNHTTLTGQIDPVDVTIDDTSAWNVTANSTLGGLTNAGNVVFVAPTGDPTLAGSYKTVTTSSYVGNGGAIALNTYLGADASPTDQLVLNGGSASGTSALKISNTTGSGAHTTSDGIPVVVATNGASTAASAFHLARPVQAGAYEYLLYRGSQSSANSWYLRSDLIPTSTTTPPGVPAPAAAAAAVPAAYRPGVAGYTMTPSLNIDYGFATLDRLHERVGDIANVEKQQPGNQNGVWGRIGGQTLDADAGSRFAADEKTFFAQFGKDWTLDHAAGGGSTHAGVTVTFGTADASFSDMARSINRALSASTGSTEMHAQSVGGYWTRYLSDGTYFDSVGQLTHYSNRYSDVYGSSASQNGFGVALSQEVGKPFYLGSSAVAIEPQAQLMYQYLKLNGFEDNISAITGTTTNALRGRLGVRVFRANMENATRTSTTTPYFTADVLHDFFSPGQTAVGGTSFDLGLGRTWYELGVGVATSFGKSGEFYANVKYSRNLEGQYRQGVMGKAGYRYSW
ncbi:autotransporter outer membrane beta-barrel domain-containing protein [Paraburkholderia sp. MMS20-SJTR3]|uniref:Autotransporter outer membrane beta-barrel domain-containing protein n=1 Tax=Paraburkholderia sejongensis TaxID=2886946 RepID=A0ABS8K3S5_9BURK|nr:autotransporter outer membrane beta-barrel domain-containing protein [Paraburkholderia sp. MMS20-SJTR3]MCC8396812.1 autotransporter outer membrane beta-barrel domain-containing protein [Paraburkholderia sp. MMS20-SJTR3]